jgi:hypothetical protein
MRSQAMTSEAARIATTTALLLAGMLATGCGDDDGGAGEPSWSVIHEGVAEGLLSVWGSSADDVWVVGSDRGQGDGPAVLRWDGTAWSRLSTGTAGDLWWVFGFAGGPVYLGGSGGVILRYQDGGFTALETPGTQVVFGIWGASPDEVWAVGAEGGGSSGGFAWRLDGDRFIEAAGFPAEVAAGAGVWKVHGRAADDVWMVGTGGLILHWDGAAFSQSEVAGRESLFTVHCAAARCVAVGGFATGLIFELGGDQGWTRVSEPDDPAVIGVSLDHDEAVAVGRDGAVMERGAGGWQVAVGPATYETLHAVWIDPAGGAWTVGGQIQSFPFGRGVVAYRGHDPPLAPL